MKVLLVDGNNLIWRGFSQAPLTYKEERTEAIYLGLKQLLYYLSYFNPDEIAVVWDAGLDKIRTDIYPEYKRPPITEPISEADIQERQEFHRQADRFKEVLFGLGLSQFSCRGREADDIIFSLIKQSRFPAISILLSNIDMGIKDFNTKGIKVKEEESNILLCSPIYSIQDTFTIISTDVDYYQLLDKYPVDIYSPVQGVMVTAEAAKEKLGFSNLEHYAFYKALLGGHDNIPGVPGIGPVRARELMAFLEGAKDVYVGVDVRSRKGLNKSFDLYESYSDNVAVWEKLCEFLEIPYLELVKGYQKSAIVSFMSWAILAKAILERFGFDSWLKNFMSFASPFESYFVRQRLRRNK